MKPLVAFALLAALALPPLPGSAQSTPRPWARSAQAPADQYFGRMRMSILGIRNTIHDMDARASQAVPEDASYVLHKLMLTEDALHDWATRYPHDSWVPKMTWSLAMVYKKLPLLEAQDRMNDQLDWLEAMYPESDEANFAR